MGLTPVRNASVWNTVKILFLGSALLFLINIFFGFDNALTPAGTVIPRWQILIHLHAGTVGWITLSVIGLLIWVYTGQREVSGSYVRGVGILAWTAIIAFGGYIISFGLAFSQAGPVFFLLPTFGVAAAGVIWAAFIWSLVQLRRQAVVTTVHLLIMGALLVVAVGALFGVLLGLEHIVGLFIPGSDRIGTHAGLMDTYLFLAAAAIVEGFVRKDPNARWTRAGLVQALSWIIAALLVPIFIVFTLPQEVILVFVILLFLGLGLFLARMGGLALTKNPLRADPTAWSFYGTIWLIVFLILFAYAAFVLLPNPELSPSWFGTIFVHSAFVGMMTNLLLGLYSARTQDVRHILATWEPTAILLLNLGILVFFLLKITQDLRIGAIFMGIGVILGVLTMVARLGASGGGTSEGAPS
ncbi:MAG: hypothetical protein LN413_04115 [Candidatus Thermoplasmatota archaeon]|nr:hypothetical protein [Candidatus Thermoplasmatota archaeon]